jgi:hypothetical protein
MEFDGIDDAVVDTDFERAPAKLTVPPDAAKKLPDRFHGHDINTKTPRIQRDAQ